jgi:hypothetical protein
LLLLVPCSPIVWTQKVRSTFVHNCAWKFHSSALDSVPMCIQVYSTMHQVHPTLSRCTQLHPGAFNCAQVHCYTPKVGIAHSLRVHAMPVVCLTIMQRFPNMTLLGINLLRFPNMTLLGINLLRFPSVVPISVFFLFR